MITVLTFRLFITSCERREIVQPEPKQTPTPIPQEKSVEIKPEEKMQARKKDNRIEGHCDKRGTNEYNLALGDKRAEATKDILGALGVVPSRIETISYGEEKPLCTVQNEDC